MYLIAIWKDLKSSMLLSRKKIPKSYNPNSLKQRQLHNKLNNPNKAKGKSEKNENAQEIKIFNAIIKLKKVVK